MRYRRAYAKGGCYFFTVVTAGRRPILQSADSIDCLRAAFRRVRLRYPFAINAIVILPDHLHCVWTLPENDDDFSTRWRLIKSGFSRHTAHPSPYWQPRFWEHLIRNDKDYARHIDYVHYNPVKHGYVCRPADWPYSSFARYARQGLVPIGWGSIAPVLPAGVGKE